MPLGNLTSQFFANVYLNELDYFIKQELKAEYYIRYVDDFVILHKSKEMLEYYKNEISIFLKTSLSISLHSEKSSVFPLYQGVNFLGLKIFPHHKIIQNRNIRKFKNKLEVLCKFYDKEEISYDGIYNCLEGWCAYTKMQIASSLKKRLFAPIAGKFANEMSDKEINRCLNLLKCL